MRSLKDLEQQGRDLVRGAIEAHRTVAKSWAVQSLVAQNSDFAGPDADIGAAALYYAADKIVQAEIRSFKVESGKARQQSLFGEGFKHLQRAYLISRDSESTLVPVERMTPDEVSAKAQEFRAMGDGCYEHASELEQFHRERSAVVAEDSSLHGAG